MTQLTDMARDVFRAIDAHDLHRVEEMIAPDCDFVAPGFSTRDPAVAAGWIGAFLGAFPDLRHELGSIAADGDLVAVELRVTGTHTGALPGPTGDVPPTGRPVDFRVANIWRVGDGQIAMYHVFFDQLDFLAQLGLLPEPAEAG
jgi:ketosteroid isomerase-like protein